MSSILSPLKPAAAAVRLFCLGLAVAAIPASANAADEAVVADAAPQGQVQSVEVAGTRDDNAGFAARRAGSTKSDTPLFETPQAITVLTRELLDSRQVTTLNEAIQSTAGVASGGWGRRGWDDFIIRGQRASESIYVDGLKLAQSNWVAQEVYGVERIEVLKGPASINFGLVQPGGMVNMVSKRPKANAFNEVGFTLGNHGYKQATFDLGRPLAGSASGKQAFRLNGMISDQDDPTDKVYFKNKYLAPSLSLDFGANTDFTVLSAYSKHDYLRQQGLPVVGTVKENINGPIDRARFAGEPDFGAYKSTQKQIGYALVHRFESGWKLQQNFRWQELSMDGHFVSLGTLQANQRLQNRSAQLQDVDARNLALDSNLERSFEIGGMRHTVMAGLDLGRNVSDTAPYACTLPALDLYNPVYGVAVACGAQPRERTNSEVKYGALYLRDQIKLSDRLSLNLAGRHDRITNTDINLLSSTTQEQKSSANTGNGALMFELTPHFAPYISYATSFLPVAGTDFFGVQFKPEEGQQSEIGTKFQFDEGRINGSIALYDLKRQNVTTADPDQAHIALRADSQVQTGEQRSKGFEAEINADLRNGWSVQGALAVINAVVTEDNGGTEGRRLLNTPRRTFSTWANYRFRDGLLRNWGAGAGLRYESEKSGPSVNYTVGGYTAADANISYQGNGYKVQLNVKNLFDREYYAGVLSNNVVTLGDPRTVMLKAVLDF